MAQIIHPWKTVFLTVKTKVESLLSVAESPRLR